MIKLFLPVIALTLAGCATSPSELRTTEPSERGHTDKSAQAYMGCVLERWNEKNIITPISSQPLSNGYTAQVTDMARGVVMLLDVRDDEKIGSSYIFYKRRDMSFYEEQIRNCK